MTTFIDGPAKGQKLMLKRAPMLLRAVVQDGKWDALNYVVDTPRPGEAIHAYVMVEQPSHCHINRGRNGSGFYSIAQYRYIHPQAPEKTMRVGEAWSQWCHANAALVSHLL